MLWVWCVLFVFVMHRLPPRYTRTEILFPYTTLCRSVPVDRARSVGAGERARGGRRLPARGPARRTRPRCRRMGVGAWRAGGRGVPDTAVLVIDRKSTRLNSSH